MAAIAERVINGDGPVIRSDQYFSSNAVGKAEIADIVITGLAIGALTGFVALHLLCPPAIIATLISAATVVLIIHVAAIVSTVFVLSMLYSKFRRVDVDITKYGNITVKNRKDFTVSCKNEKLTATLNGVTRTMRWNRGQAYNH